MSTSNDFAAPSTIVDVDSVPVRRRLWYVSISAVVLATVAIVGAGFDPATIAPDLPTAIEPGGLSVSLTLFVFLAAAFCEFIDSCIGMGYGTTLTPVLLLAGIDPLKIVPAVLASELVTGLAAAVMHHRDGNVDWLRESRARISVLLLTGIALVGAAMAPFVASGLSRRALTATISGIVITTAVVLIAARRQLFNWRPQRILLTGLVASFCKAISGGGYGPLVMAGQVMAGVRTRTAVAVTSVSESIVCGVALISYWVRGRNLDWGLVLPLLLGAVCTVPLATLTVRRAGEARLRTAVGLAAGVLGALTLIRQFE